LTSALVEKQVDSNDDDNNDSEINCEYDCSDKKSPATVVRIVLVSPDLKPVLDSLKATGQLPFNLAIVECGLGCELDCWTETKRFAYLEGGSRYQQQQQKSIASRWDDTCLYIYTSGTTGLPKASKLNHIRIWSAGCATNKVCLSGMRN